MVQDALQDLRKSAGDKIKDLEDELKKTKYNKRTQHHIGLVKAKLARLKERREARSSGGKKGEGFSVRKTGDGTAVLLGFPSVGKSTLLNALTNAHSPVGAYAFTTLTVIPGLLEYNQAKIQILDVPGIVAGAAAGTGRGKEVLQVIRTADLVIMLLDVFHPEHYAVLLNEVNETGVRLNLRKPDVRITKTIRGGIRIGRTVQCPIADETIRGILREFRVSNADVLIRTPINEDQLIDLLEGITVYLPAITVVTKIDLASPQQIQAVHKQFPGALFVSAEANKGIDDLKLAIYEKLDLIRIYMKEVGKKADMDEPMIMFRSATLRSVCEKLHRDFVTKFRFARIWGSSVKFPGQKVLRLDHQLRDGDVIELRIS